MAILPLAVGIFAEFSRAGYSIGPVARWAAAGALMASALFGLPTQVGSAILFWQDRDYNRVVSLLEGRVHEDDWVYCDPAAYYPAKAMADTVFMKDYDTEDRFFTPEEKQRISVMVIAPRTLAMERKRIGGSWEAIGEPVRPPKRGLLFFKVNFGDKLVANYDLQVFRRKSGGIQPAPQRVPRPKG
jgi:hypothetical protein